MKFVPKGLIKKYSSTGSDNGLAGAGHGINQYLKQWRLYYRRIYAPFGLNGLNDKLQVNHLNFKFTTGTPDTLTWGLPYYGLWDLVKQGINQWNLIDGQVTLKSFPKHTGITKHCV